MAYQARGYPGFCSIMPLEYFYSPLDGMLVHNRVTPSIMFADNHLYTWVVRGPVRVIKVSCPRMQSVVPKQRVEPRTP